MVEELGGGRNGQERSCGREGELLQRAAGSRPLEKGSSESPIWISVKPTIAEGRRASTTNRGPRPQSLRCSREVGEFQERGVLHRGKIQGQESRAKSKDGHVVSDQRRSLLGGGSLALGSVAEGQYRAAYHIRMKERSVGIAKERMASEGGPGRRSARWAS